MLMQEGPLTLMHLAKKKLGFLYRTVLIIRWKYIVTIICQEPEPV